MDNFLRYIFPLAAFGIIAYFLCQLDFYPALANILYIVEGAIALYYVRVITRT